jgi:hypothetical protein
LILAYKPLGFNHHAFIIYNRVQVARLYDRWAIQEFLIETRSLELFKGLQVYPCCADGSLERIRNSQLGSWAPAAGGPAKFQRTGGRVRPGAGGGRLAGPWGSILGLGRVGAVAGGLGRQHRATPAAVASSPARGEAKPDNGGRWKLQGMLGEAPGALIGGGGESRGGLGCGGAHGATELGRGRVELARARELAGVL